MVKIELKFAAGIPQYTCSSCGRCGSVFARSLCAIKNRGCCFYFPKFTLVEIHRMSKSSEGLKVLNNLLKLPGVKVYNYYIHATGYFDSAAYKRYLQSGQISQYKVRDKSIFFKVCPFVKPGKGCTLPPQYRNFICNSFICDEVVERVQECSAFRYYKDERVNYADWVQWENDSLRMQLEEKKLDLVDDLDGVIATLKGTPLRNYMFPDLPPLEVAEQYGIGA